MSLIDTLSAWFGGASTTEAPQGVCVNCWGHQEYDGQIREVARSREIDFENKVQRRAFIEEFAVKHVDGIKLHRTEQGLRCNACGTETRL